MAATGGSYNGGISSSSDYGSGGGSGISKSINIIEGRGTISGCHCTLLPSSLDLIIVFSQSPNISYNHVNE